MKVANVKATLLVKLLIYDIFFKYSQTIGHNKYFTVNFNKLAMETNFKNNVVKIPRFKG